MLDLSLPCKPKIVNRKCSGCRWLIFRYIIRMNWLTKQEQLVLCAIIGLLLTGLAVKYYRGEHPSVTVARQSN